MLAVLKVYIFALLKRVVKNFYSLGVIGESQCKSIRKRLVRLGEVKVFVNDIEMPMILNVADVGVSHSLILKGTYEPTEMKIFKKIIKKGSIFVDIGANFGYYSLLAANLVGKKGKVLAFEPDPYNCSILRKNIKLNNFSNIDLYDKAVADKKGNLTLFVSFDLLGDHNTVFDRDREKIIVEKLDLDSLDLKSKIDVIKIDVQGTEELVFKGLKKIITKNQNIIIMTEFCPDLIRSGGLRPQDLSDLIISLGLEGIIYTPDGIELVNTSKQLLDAAEIGWSINVFLKRKNSRIKLVGL